MNAPLNADEVLVPLAMATGAFNPYEAVKLLAYRGVGVVVQEEIPFLRLSVAIQWNEDEAADASSRAECLYRTALAAHLKGCAASGELLVYTPDLWALWARVFEDDARMVANAPRKDVPAELREIIRNALQ